VKKLQETFDLSENDALIITDIQKDFCEKGALPVPAAEEIIPVINDYIKIFNKTKAKIFATRDWHPANHISFKQRGGSWPPHCVQDTEGAKFHPDLKLPITATILSKAIDPDKEAYSSFEGTTLEQQLKKQNVQRIFVGGLTAEYCVKTTILDAISLGFKAILLQDATRGLEQQVGDTEKALAEMTKNGAQKATLADFSDDPELPTENENEPIESDDEPIAKATVKKKARLRSRGTYRQIKTER
jgi:nicotinamidase-related amidase